jgi:hypothetical protein
MPAAPAQANVFGKSRETSREGGKPEMREVCYCGRTGELENREPVLEGGDG